ncbi:MAG: prolipoprotein diacylglyceryl transferase [Planctomycetota bacterium]
MSPELLVLAQLTIPPDPIWFSLGSVNFYYYGLCYAIGFAVVAAHLYRNSQELGINLEGTYEAALCFAFGSLAGGRCFEIFVYEWALYRDEWWEVLHFWNGGMASHGVMLGAVAGIFAFAKWRRRPFLLLVDTLVLPGALMMALGRLGNFINGEIYGPHTEAWWGVAVPYAEGLRHPVPLYDALKNLGVAVILLVLSRRHRCGEGRLFAHFLVWYGGLRLIVDLYREYGSEFWGIGRGQFANAGMALVGLFALAWLNRRVQPCQEPAAIAGPEVPAESKVSALWFKRTAFAAMLVACLAIPSGWSEGWLEGLAQTQRAALSQATRLSATCAGSPTP